MFNRNFSVAAVVSNGKSSARWYSERLGFTSSVRGTGSLSGRRGQTGRFTSAGSGRAKLEPGKTGISFYAKDVEGTVKELKKRGVKFEKDFT